MRTPRGLMAFSAALSGYLVAADRRLSRESRGWSASGKVRSGFPIRRTTNKDLEPAFDFRQKRMGSKNRRRSLFSPNRRSGGFGAFPSAQFFWGGASIVLCFADLSLFQRPLGGLSTTALDIGFGRLLHSQPRLRSLPSGAGRALLLGDQGAKRKCMTSPSCTAYSLPSRRILPASFAPASPPSATKSR